MIRLVWNLLSRWLRTPIVGVRTVNGSWPIAVFNLGMMAGISIPAEEKREHAEAEEATDAASLSTADLVEIESGVIGNTAN